MSNASQASRTPCGLTRPQSEAFKGILGGLSPEAALDKLEVDLQTAIQVELATIPIYLYTYYSVMRKPPSSPWTDVPASALYAGKAGGLIMSVAVEEMLHMSLSSNIFFALFGKPPELYQRSPASYPTKLPHHKLLGPRGPDGKRVVEIPLAKLSYEQLWHFLQIEYPSAPGDVPTDTNWQSLSQFYGYIRYLMERLSDEHFRVGSTKFQIQPYNYSPNNIDTLFAKGAFDPWLAPGSPERGGFASAAHSAEFGNRPDSHAGPSELMTVSSRQDAFDAITTISNQGEGASQTGWDDPDSDQEMSHFFKFLSLQAQLEPYLERKEELPDWAPGLDPPGPLAPTISEAELEGVTVRFPDNPTTAQYPKYREVSDFCNGVYQYMLILTETVFKVPADPNLPPEEQQQKLFFNRGMHQSMIWVLDKLIQAMRRGDLGNGYFLAPTFENICLGERRDAWGNLQRLAKAIPQGDVEALGIGSIMKLTANPDLDVRTYW